MKTNYINPLIIQRADPQIFKHTDGYYYFSASVPSYNLIELRRAKTLNGLAHAAPRTIWHKHNEGEMSQLIWAPELHFIQGKWYIYFAASQTSELDENGMFQHRMFVLESDAVNPMDETAEWKEKGQIKTHIDSFSLDATVFTLGKKLYYVWAQKDPAIQGNSNIYIAEMKNPWTLKTNPVLLTKPEFDWEKEVFWVNEGPAILHHKNKLFLTYSASATDENYAVGMLSITDEQDVLNPHNWKKANKPVFESNSAIKQFGPGHNSFTVSEDGESDIFVYHSRNYTNIVGDPLYDPNRHTCVQKFDWDDEGNPMFGTPIKYTYN